MKEEHYRVIIVFVIRDQFCFRVEVRMIEKKNNILGMHGTVAGDVAVCLPLNCNYYIIIIWRLNVTVSFFDHCYCE